METRLGSHAPRWPISATACPGAVASGRHAPASACRARKPSTAALKAAGCSQWAECPASAIYAEDDVPDAMHGFIALNAELAKTWPVISERKEPLDDADAWNGVADKLDKLER